MALLFHTFSIPRYWYLYDANTNSILSVEEEQYNALSEIERGAETTKNLKVLKCFQDRGFCLDVTIEKMDNPDGEIIQEHLSKMIQQCTLQITQKCNLRCGYCTYSGHYKTRCHSPQTMSFETAKRAIDFTLYNSEDTHELAFGFYGGEPLLELPMINKCINYINEMAPNRRIMFTLTTNGTLLTVDVYKNLIANNININISLDGPKQIHDMSRRFPNGNGSYDVIMNNIKIIQDRHPDAYEKIRFLAVINPEIDDEKCIQTLFRYGDITAHYNYHSNFISELYSKRGVDYSEAFLLAYNHEYCKFLLSLLGKLNKEDISTVFDDRKGVIDMEYKRLSRIKELPNILHPGGPCIAGAKRLFVDVHGNLFPCERVSENSQIMNIGNLDKGFDFDKVRMLINPAHNTEDECKECWGVLHCTMCAAFSDNLTELSRDMRLSRCKDVLFQYETTLKTICFLKESGYHFEK